MRFEVTQGRFHTAGRARRSRSAINLKRTIARASGYPQTGRLILPSLARRHAFPLTPVRAGWWDKHCQAVRGNFGRRLAGGFERTREADVPGTGLPPKHGTHSITSSARARSVGGGSRPRALAALRLTTSSNLVGCSMGRSAAFAPLRILSTEP